MRKPSPGGIPASIAKRLRGARYAVGDVVFVVGRAAARVGRVLIRVPVAIGRGIAGFWRSLSVIARRRLVAAGAVAVALLILFSAVVPNLPCQFPGGDSCPPSDDAAELVPAEALVYAHANLDPETDQYESVAELATDLPVLSEQLIARVPALIRAPGGDPPDFEEQVRPWFGGEAAIALIDGPALAPERVDLLEVADAEGATEYAEALAVGQATSSEYEGIEVSVDGRDVATAQVEGFLAIGSEDAVRAVIATATGADGAEPLADSAAATELLDQLPDHRVAEAWISEDGIDDVVATDTGALRTLTPLIAPGASAGAAASLSAADGELELAVRSTLDPERAEQSPGFFAAFPPFEPALPARLRPQTLAYLGFGAPSKTVTALLSQAGAQAPGIAAGFEDLVRTLRRDANVDIEEELVGALGDEAAFALEPPPGEGETPLTGLPYLLFVAGGVDEDAARRGLAALAGPLSGTVQTGNDGQAPVFGQDEVAGVETNRVRVSPTVELTYAVFDDLAAIATDPAGVAGVIEDAGGLNEAARYEQATEDFPDQVALQAYLDLEGLVDTGERAGLAEDPVYAAFAGEFRRLDAFALAVDVAEDLLATDARLLIGPAPPPDATEPSLAPPSD